MIGSEWETADKETRIKIVGEADPMEGGWSYRFVKVRGRATRSQKTKTISDPVLRSYYTRTTPKQGADVIR